MRQRCAEPSGSEAGHWLEQGLKSLSVAAATQDPFEHLAECIEVFARWRVAAAAIFPPRRAGVKLEIPAPSGLPAVITPFQLYSQLSNPVGIDLCELV